MTQLGQRISCSGRARRVLDHIDTQERRLRPEIDLTLPLAPWIMARLRYQHPMTAAEWDQMMRTLEAMKPGIVEEPRVSPVPYPGGER